MNAVAPKKNFDPVRYGRLLAKVRPAIITSEEENERALAEVEALMRKGESLSPEEGALLQLLGQLVSDFEEREYQPEAAQPSEVLRELMEAHGLAQSDLLDVFGSRSRASEAVAGKRAISKAQARRLAERFHVPADLFI